LLSRKLRQKLDELTHKTRQIEAKGPPPAPRPPSGPVPLSEAFPGQVVETPTGPFLLWERPVGELLDNSEELHSKYSAIFECGGWTGESSDLHPDLRALLDADPGRVLYLDIETTGLSVGAAFLVGLTAYESGSIVVKQLLARDYSEEAPLLSYLAEMFDRCEAMVSFNGKSFDVRFLQERFIVNGVSCFPSFAHLDLLHEGRRRWKDILPNCKLQTLEKHFCGRTRYGDIPGEEIPDAYHDFVKTGDAVRVKDIVHHNALDLVTMVEVIVHILSGREEMVDGEPGMVDG